MHNSDVMGVVGSGWYWHEFGCGNDCCCENVSHLLIKGITGMYTGAWNVGSSKFRRLHWIRKHVYIDCSCYDFVLIAQAIQDDRV